MNENISDPILRTFRLPISVRLREKLDTQREVIDAQAATIIRQNRDVTRLNRELERARKRLELARKRGDSLAVIAETFALRNKGVTPTPEIIEPIPQNPS